MTLLNQDEIDSMSTVLQRATLNRSRLPEVEIAAWFVNLPDGPQFWIGQPARHGMQPLFFEPAGKYQEAVAWLATHDGAFITQDRSAYRADIEWKPLYLAR